MNKFISIIFLFLFSLPSFAEWLKFGETVKKNVFYYETKSIKRKSNFIYYHQMIDLLKPMNIGNKYILSMKSYIKIDCNTFNLKVEYLKSFDEPLGSGTTVSSGVPSLEWEIPKSGSIDSNINKYLCKNY